jgi:hypothetical protein
MVDMCLLNTAAGERILTYGRWLETVKYVDQSGVQHMEANAKNKKIRRNLKTTFTSEGQPGHVISNLADSPVAILQCHHSWFV